MSVNGRTLLPSVPALSLSKGWIRRLRESCNMAKKTTGQWRDTWQALSRPNKVTFILSVIAIILTIISLSVDIIQNKQQNDLSREMFFFQIEAEANARDQEQKQIDIQNTQTALNAQLESIARLQAFPLIVVVSSEKPVLVVTQIGDTNGNTLLVTGNIDMILANNGGARAGLISINWLNNTSLSTDLLKLAVDQVYISETLISLPTSIEGQTPVRIKIDMNAELRQHEISDDEFMFGNKDYQLQKYILNTLNSAGSKIEFQFSNADAITIPVSNIVIDINGFQPQGPTTPSPYMPNNWEKLLYINNVFVYLMGFLVILVGYFILKSRRQK